MSTAVCHDIFNRCPECGGRPERLRWVSDKLGVLYSFQCFTATCELNTLVREQLSESAARAEWERLCAMTPERRAHRHADICAENDRTMRLAAIRRQGDAR